MAFPFEELFLGLLAAYCLYSVYVRLDGRYPIAGALLLLVAAAVLEAAGNTGAANTVAVYVFFLLAAGVLLLLVEHVREERATGRTRTGPDEESEPGAPGASEAEHPIDRQWDAVSLPQPAPTEVESSLVSDRNEQEEPAGSTVVDRAPDGSSTDEPPDGPAE